jgi:hypothetical protein
VRNAFRMPRQTKRRRKRETPGSILDRRQRWQNLAPPAAGLPRSSALDPTRYSGHSAASRTRREVGAQAVLCPPECDHDRPEQMITITGMYTRRLLNCDDYNYWPDSEV